jgi:hypothetical protein
MSLLSQIPKPSFIFDPSQANESRDALTQVRRIADQSGGGFTRAGSKYVVNKAGVLVEVPAGVPAVEFDGAFNKGYLAEPSATNLLQRSEEFDNAVWIKTGANITPNDAVAPDGEPTADKLVESTSTGAHSIAQLLSNAPVNTYTFSVFIKPFAGSRNIAIYPFRSTDAGGTATRGVVFTQTGEFVGFEGTGTNPSFAVSKSQTGWLRLSVTGATASIANIAPQIRLADGVSVSYTGDGTSGIFIWGAQLETGSVATSYIPTVASTATRPADSLVFTGAQDLIGQDWVILVEIDLRIYSGSFVNIFTLYDSSNILVGTLSIRRNTSPINLEYGWVGTGNFTNTNLVNSSGKYKILLSKKGLSQQLFVNSVKEFRTANTEPNKADKIGIGNRADTGGNVFGDTIKSAYLWNNADWITDELAKTLTRL